MRSLIPAKLCYQDLVTSAPLSPTTAVDRMGSVFVEPLNTSDALERYQQVSQKVQICFI